MNFFERQQQVRRMSGRLVLLFALAVIGIVITIDLVVLLLTGGLDQPPETMIPLLIATSLILLTMIGLASLFKSLSLRSGGGPRVAQALGAVPVPPHPTDPQLRRLRNVVEEIAIASGTPVPELFVMEGEPGINAFAAGWSPSDAAVAVTRGALERLNRDELQGVIAHEFSHVVNGDMRLNIKLMGLLFGILVLFILGRILLAIRGGKNNPIPLIGLALMVCGGIGLLMGRIIKAAVSRQREFLADASAVQFTRQTSGLTGALKKIAGLPTGSRVRNAKAEDVSHMLFGSGKGFSGMFATHPPLFKRIQVLDPTVTEAELRALQQRYAAAPPSGLAEDQALGLTGPRDLPAGTAPAGTGPALPAAGASVRVSADQVAAAVGDPQPVAFQRAESILSQLPEPVLERARDPRSVVPLVFGLLLSHEPAVRVNQHAALAARHGQAAADAAWQEGNVLAGLHPILRLPLAEVAFPALRHRPQPEQDAIVETVQALIHADGRISVSEYCLSRLLQQELYEAGHRGHPSWGTRRHSLSSSRSAGATLLAVLAQVGQPDPAHAAQAFAAGAARLFPRQQLPYAPPAQGVAALEAVWPPLDGLNPQDKQVLVQSLVTVIGHDGVTTIAELELLRTICALLHCPLPPLSELAPVPRHRPPGGPGQPARGWHSSGQAAPGR